MLRMFLKLNLITLLSNTNLFHYVNNKGKNARAQHKNPRVTRTHSTLFNITIKPFDLNNIIMRCVKHIILFAQMLIIRMVRAEDDYSACITDNNGEKGWSERARWVARDPSARPLWVEEKPHHCVRCISLIIPGNAKPSAFPQISHKASRADKLQFVINHLFSQQYNNHIIITDCAPLGLMNLKLQRV